MSAHAGAAPDAQLPKIGIGIDHNFSNFHLGAFHCFLAYITFFQYKRRELCLHYTGEWDLFQAIRVLSLP